MIAAQEDGLLLQQQQEQGEGGTAAAVAAAAAAAKGDADEGLAAVPSPPPSIQSSHASSYVLPPLIPSAVAGQQFMSTLVYHDITETSGVKVEAVMVPFPNILR